jgi:hypothetical protein
MFILRFSGLLFDKVMSLTLPTRLDMKSRSLRAEVKLLTARRTAVLNEARSIQKTVLEYARMIRCVKSWVTNLAGMRNGTQAKHPQRMRADIGNRAD